MLHLTVISLQRQLEHNHIATEITLSAIYYLNFHSIHLALAYTSRLHRILIARLFD